MIVVWNHGAAAKVMLKTPSYQPTHTDPSSAKALYKSKVLQVVSGKTFMAAISRMHVMII